MNVGSPRACRATRRSGTRGSVSRALGVIALAGASVACQAKTIQLDSNAPVTAVAVSLDPDGDAGVGGKLEESISTAFASAVWQYRFFDRVDGGAAALAALAPHHVLVQVIDSPLKGSSDASQWDFTELDAIVQPLLALGADPIIQIYSTPPGTKVDTDPSAFGDFCADLVRYYNSDAGLPLGDGGSLHSGAGRPVHWWAVWSDPNTDPSTIADPAIFGALYNVAIAKMLAVDRSLQFSAPEVNHCVDGLDATSSPQCQPARFVPGFLAATAGGALDGGKTPIDALSIHMYSADLAVSVENGLPSDRTVFKTVANFTADLTTSHQELVDAGRGDTPIWVTENQVNSDTPRKEDGVSAHGATTPDPGPVPFVADPRGTSAFFAAWRPYLFSQLGKAGNRELFQWQFTAGQCPADASDLCSLLDSSDTDRQNAEIDYRTGKKYLSYWVDASLARKFPPGGTLLHVDVNPPGATDSDLEVLATKSTAAGKDTVVVMVVNRAVHDPSDRNGLGVNNPVLLDLRGLPGAAADAGGPFSTPREMVLDVHTDLDGGPVETEVPIPNGWLVIPFSGYGVAFVTLDRPSRE
jgi:hypothetical protein